MLVLMGSLTFYTPFKCRRSKFSSYCHTTVLRKARRNIKGLVYFDFSNLKVSTSSAGTFQAVNPRKPWNGLSTTIVNVDTHERYGSLVCLVSKEGIQN